MTLDIEEMKRDREAGTPGPWLHGHFADKDHPCDCKSILGMHGGMGALALMQVDNGLPISEGGNDAPDVEQSRPNARRIARVPDMEARIISDADRIFQLEKDRNDARDRALVEALYAIAEASMGDPEGNPGDEALHQAYSAVSSLRAIRGQT